jgi:cell division septation protein DedD
MDEYIPLEQRQQGVALAGELQSQADATRARQMAAVDLGNQSVGASPSSAARALQPRGPNVASADDAVSVAGRVAGNTDSVSRPPVLAPAPPPATRPVASASPAPRATAVPAPQANGGSWRIQLGAFGQAANADALWSRVKGRAELTGHPRLNVKAGAVTKLQAGGFASQAAAQAVCGKLKAAGFECVAVAG